METINEKGQSDPRIIVLSKDSLVEADVITGVNVLTLSLKHLIRIEDITSNICSTLHIDIYLLSILIYSIPYVVQITCIDLLFRFSLYVYI